MSYYSSSSDSEEERVQIGRKRPIHATLGGGKVADVLLWKNKRVSAAILFGVATIWFLFEVAEFNFLTLLCHLTITAMLVIFIWAVVADIFHWNPPRIPDVILHDSSFGETISKYIEGTNESLIKFIDFACGSNFRNFILVISSLWVLSTLGNYISTLNLIFLGCLCLETLPYLYNLYEEEVDHLVNRITYHTRRSYKKFEKNVLRKIPRGPVRGKEATLNTFL